MDSNQDKRNQNPTSNERNSLANSPFGQDDRPLTAPLTGTAASGCEPVRAADPDLSRVLAAWPNLPPHLRAAVLALIGTAG